MLEMIGQAERYRPDAAAVFFRTRENFGGLSNMAAGFPLTVAEVTIRTSEALYQACRFPDDSDLQRRIIAERSPMSAKMLTKPRINHTRPDWDRVRVRVMRWCLQVKLVQHPGAFGDLLRSTEGLPIVEKSRRDAFWGAIEQADGTLVGTNTLGRLLTAMRDELVGNGRAPETVAPLDLPDFTLLGRAIPQVGRT